MQTIQKPLHARFSRKQQFLFFLVPLILSLLFQWFFYDHEPGINYPLFLAALYIGYLSLFWDRIQKKSVAGWSTMIASLVLSLVFALYQSTPILSINFALIPLLALTSGFLLTGWNSAAWFDLAFIGQFFPKALVRLLENIPTPIRSVLSLLEGKKSSTTSKQILKGVIVAIPLLLVILSLLASADAVFESFISDITHVFDFEIADQVIGRIAVTLAALWGLATFAWMIASEHNTTKPAITSYTPSISSISAITILALVNIAYFVFLLIQFAYLFNGADLSFLDNMTYAEYARRGFAELVAIAVINLSLTITFAVFVKNDSPASLTTQRVFSSLLVLATMIILYSSQLRLGLYEEAYGFTHTRILVHVFMFFLAASLLVSLAKIWKRDFVFLRPVLCIALFFWIGISLINLDQMIAEKNIERYEENGRIDIGYLVYELSDDAVPTLVRFAELDTSDAYTISYDQKNEATTLKICDENQCYHFASYHPSYENLPWQEWNYSQSWKNNYLEYQIAQKKR